MPTLIDALKRKIVEEASARAGASGKLRLEFSGPPIGIIRRLLASFVQEGGLKLSNGETILVLMIDDAVVANPAALESGSCTESYVVRVRAGNDPYYLLLLPPHHESNASLDTTILTIGVKSIGEDTPEWKWWEQPFVQELAHDLVEAMGVVLPDPDVLRRAFQDAGAVSSLGDDRGHQWALFDKLFSLTSGAGPAQEEVLAMIGLPRCSVADAPVALKILDEVAQRLYDEGISRAVEGWIARAHELALGNDVQAALEEFATSLQSCCSAPVFHRAPSYWYSPSRRLAQQDALPAWWGLLDLGVWQRLVGEEEAKPVNGIEIEVTNSQFKVRSTHVVKGDVQFKLTTPEAKPNLGIVVRRGSSPTGAVSVAELTPVNRVANASDTLPASNRAIVYRAEALSASEDVAPARLSVVSLVSFGARAAFYSPLAKNFTLPRLQPKKQEGARVWSSDVVFAGPGAHQIDILVAEGCALVEPAIVTRTGDDGNGAGSEPETCDIGSGFDGRRTLRLDIHEPTTVTIKLALENGEHQLLRVVCGLEQDEVSQGYRSEYRRLVAGNANPSRSASAATILPRWTYLERIQNAAIKDRESFRPSVISVDALQASVQLDWTGNAIFSQFGFTTDIRPPKAEFLPPEALIECREKIQALLQAKEVELLETVELAGLLDDLIPSSGVTFGAVLVDYVREYTKWASTKPEVALWFDVVAYVLPQENTSVLSVTPQAILLSPLHPLRLGWQCLAQKVLRDAMDAGKACPGSTYFEPATVPDASPLWIWGAAGTATERYYLALDCDSDYWSILWDASTLADLNRSGTTGLFSD